MGSLLCKGMRAFFVLLPMPAARRREGSLQER